MAISRDDKDAIELLKRIDIIFQLTSDMEFKQKVIEIMRNKTYNEYDKPLHNFLLQELQSRRPNDAKIIPQILNRELNYFNPLTKPVVLIPAKPIHEKSSVQHKEKSKKISHTRLGLFGSNMDAKETNTEATPRLAKKEPTHKKR